MQRAVTAAEMFEIERLAQEEFGISGATLMENAGQAVADEILKSFKKGRGAIFCGPGNNGGDGFVCARRLFESGVKVDVFIVGRSRAITKEDPARNLSALMALGVGVRDILTKEDLHDSRKLSGYDFMVDAIFGIGFRGVLRKSASDVVEFINGLGIPIYAIDVPSGLDATTGVADGSCIKARTTVTFGLPKRGLLVQGAKEFVGELIVADIGFPRELL
ncbi:MAG: NAD(P)H-hydrate epimerase [Candidatus Omnitrophota bacterium]